MNFIKLLKVLLALFLLIPLANSQFVYKTPSGSKYHLTSCKHVNNVSKRMTVDEAINKYYLSPCKICNPPVPKGALFLQSEKDKAVGACDVRQCLGETKSKARCKRKTRLCNGYCFQHNPNK